MTATSNSISPSELSSVGRSEPSSASSPSAGRNAARPSISSSPRLAANASGQKPGRVGRRRLGGPALARDAEPAAGRAAPALARGDLAGDDRAGLDLGAVADHRAGVQHRARADPRAGADLDRADDELLPVDPPAAHVDVALDGRAGADPQQRAGGRDGRQAGAVADLRADQARVARGPRRAAEPLVAGHLGEAVDEPQPRGQPGVARVAAGLDAAQQHAGGDELQRDVRGRAGEQDPRGEPADPVDVRRADVDEVAVDERAEQPRHRLDRRTG